MPTKTGLRYFPHNVDAATDEKLVALRMDTGGPLGYALYFQALERIFRDGCPLSLKERHQQIVFADRLGVSVEELLRAVEAAVGLGLFINVNWEEDRALWSKGVQDRMEKVEAQRSKWRDQKTFADFNQKDTFEKLWELYPKKRGKEAAYRHFCVHIKTKADARLVLEALRNYNAQLKEKGTSQEFTLNGSTFFYMRWKDFVGAAERPKPQEESPLARELREMREEGGDGKVG